MSATSVNAQLCLLLTLASVCLSSGGKSGDKTSDEEVKSSVGGGREFFFDEHMTVLEEIHMLENHPVSRLLDRLLLKYDRRLRPHYGGPPVVVNVTMNIDSVGPISEVDMNFRIDISFRQYWIDKRLMFNATEGIDSLTVNSNFLSNIWQPDTYFPDSYESKKQEVMVPNILLRIQPDGLVLYSARVTVIAKCPMDLMYFPMDIQECSLMVETFGYTSKDLILRWKDDDPNHRPVEFNRQKLELAQFDLINLVTKQYFLDFSTGNFSDLEVVFYFKRDLIYFIIQTYVPATLIVLLSWVNFYVNRHSVPARASLAITTVLTMITLMGATNSNLPRVSSIKALDIYFGICFLYVFGALVEFALVCYFNKPRYQPKPLAPPDKGEPAVLGAPWRYESANNRVQSNGMLLLDGPPRSPKATFTVGNAHLNTPGSLNKTRSFNYNDMLEIQLNSSGQGQNRGGGLVTPPSPLPIGRARKQLSSSSMTGRGEGGIGGDSIATSHHPLLGFSISREHSFTDFKAPPSNAIGNSPLLAKPAFDSFKANSAAQLETNAAPPSYQPQLPRTRNPRRRKGKHVPKTRSIDVSRIDLYSRIMFPLTYIMICLVYWMVYLGVSNLQDKTAEENSINIVNKP